MTKRDDLFFEHGKFEWGRRIFTRWNAHDVFIEEFKGRVRVHGLDIPYDFDTVAQAKKFIRRKIKESERKETLTDD